MPISRRMGVRIVGLVATVGFLLLFVHAGSLGQSWAALRDLPAWSVGLSLAAIGVGIGFTALRWKYLLEAVDIDVPVPRLFAALASAAAVNNVVPARGGDVLRVQSVRTSESVPALAVVGTLAAERLLDGFVLALWIVLGALVVGAAVPLLVIGLGLLALTGAGVVAAAVAARSPAHAERVTRLLPMRARPWAESFLSGLAIFRSRRLFVKALAASFALWLADVVMYAALARGLRLDLGLGGAFLLEGIGNLALAVPASAAGVGSFDYLTLLGARGIGVAGTAASAYVLVVHALIVLPATVLGLVCLRWALPASARRRSALALATMRAGTELVDSPARAERDLAPAVARQPPLHRRDHVLQDPLGLLVRGLNVDGPALVRLRDVRVDPVPHQNLDEVGSFVLARDVHLDLVGHLDPLRSLPRLPVSSARDGDRRGRAGSAGRRVDGRRTAPRPPVPRAPARPRVHADDRPCRS
jgi:uncharacterized membrane protein YbhN (UPF0104 family)